MMLAQLRCAIVCRAPRPLGVQWVGGIRRWGCRTTSRLNPAAPTAKGDLGPIFHFVWLFLFSSLSIRTAQTSRALWLYRYVSCGFAMLENDVVGGFDADLLHDSGLVRGERADEKFAPCFDIPSHLSGERFRQHFFIGGEDIFCDSQHSSGADAPYSEGRIAVIGGESALEGETFAHQVRIRFAWLGLWMGRLRDALDTRRVRIQRRGLPMRIECVRMLLLHAIRATRRRQHRMLREHGRSAIGGESLGLDGGIAIVPSEQIRDVLPAH